LSLKSKKLWGEKGSAYPRALWTARLRYVAVCISLSSCCACSKPTIRHRLPPDWPQLTAATRVHLDTDAMGGRFFPQEELPWPNHDGIVARSLAGLLGGLREPSFICSQPNEPGFEAYRFFWVPSFHKPIVVRIMRSGDSAPLLWATESAESDTVCGRGQMRTGILTGEQWRAFTAKIDATVFWDAKSQLTRGTDGSTWLFEGVGKGRHHVVMRSDPGPDDPFRALGLHFLALSGIVPSGPP